MVSAGTRSRNTQVFQTNTGRRMEKRNLAPILCTNITIEIIKNNDRNICFFKESDTEMVQSHLVYLVL